MKRKSTADNVSPSFHKL